MDRPPFDAPDEPDVPDEPAGRFSAGWWLKLVLGASLIVALVLGGAYLGVRYLLWPNIDRVATHYAGTLGERLGAPLRWRTFSTEWTGWRPSLTIEGLTFGDGPSAVRIDRVAATIALRPMLTGQVAFHRLSIERPTVPLVADGPRIGLAVLGGPAPLQDRPALPEGLGWLLVQPDVRVGGATVTIDEAGRPGRRLTLEDAALVLRNRLDGSELRVDVGRPGPLAASLALQGEFRRRPFGDPADWRDWSGELRIEARRLVLEAFRILWPEATAALVAEWLPAIDGGSIASRIDPTVTLQLAGGRLQDARLRLRGDRLEIGAAGQPPLRFSQTHADLRWVPAVGGRGGELTVGPLDVVEAGGGRIASTSPSAVVLTVDDGGQPSRFAAAADALDVEPVLTAARRLLPRADWAAQLRASGRLSALRVDWRRGADGAAAAFSARGSFEQASVAWAPVPVPGPAPAAAPAPVRAPAPAGAAAKRPAGPATPAVGGGAAPAPVRAPAPAGADAKRPAGPATPAVAAAASSSPRLEWPAIRNLSGQFEASTASGQLVLRRAATQAGPSSIRFGGVFAEPEIALDELDAKLSWIIDRAAGPQWLSVRAERFAFANGDLRGSLSGRYLGGDPAQQVVDVRARVERAQANRVWRYLPLLIGEPVRHWVREAFGSGVVEGLDARWSGTVEGFPYRLKPGPGAGAGTAEPAGQFRIGARLRDVLFQAAKDWPAIHGVQGELVFDRASMRFEAERAQVFEVPISPVSARIDDLARAVVEVRGQARGDAAQFLKFVTDSPLGATLGAAVAPITVGGPATLELGLTIPLSDVAGTRVSGRIGWTQGRFALADSGLTLAEVDGSLAFSEQTLSFERIAARLHGRPVDLSGRIARPGVLHLQADGRADTGVLRGLIGDHPLYGQLSGSAAYRAVVDLAAGGLRVQVDSDLVGLASRLPAPAAKSADAARPLLLTLERGAGQTAERISASLGGEVSLLAERVAPSTGAPAALSRAALAINRPPVLPDQGLSLQVTDQRVDLDEWLVALDAMAGSTPAPEASPAPGGASGPRPASSPGAAPPGGAVVAAELPVAINLVADELRVGGRNFSRVVIGASRDGDRWNANIAAREINGYVGWAGPSLARGRLTARLGRLEIPQSERAEADGSDGEPTRRLPALDISADRFVLGGIDLGSLSLLASNPADRTAERGWTIDRLRLANPGAEFEARGRWQKATALDYTLKVIDAGQLLERFQIHKAVKGGAGTLSGRIEWPGSPTAFDRSRLDGQLDIEIRDGQFLKVEPGAAKLIGVLNLQALPKLLSLDFRDIFGEGFAFSELRGQARIRRGVASTDSLAMRGLQAVVQIKGEADLKAQTQNLRVVVLPELNGGLATLAFAALVNPAVGLGALLAQSVLSQPLSRAFAYEIDVTGPWANPTVTERRRERFGPPENQ